MPETKHTPGPWAVDAYRSEARNNCVYIKGPTGILVAQALHGPCALDPTLEQLADANLIAAAPELLEALEMAAQTWLMPFPGDCAEKWAVYNQAVAAIAKAKGK